MLRKGKRAGRGQLDRTADTVDTIPQGPSRWSFRDAKQTHHSVLSGDMVLQPPGESGLRLLARSQVGGQKLSTA